MITDCRSEEGITVGLIDGLIAIARVLAKRDLTPDVVGEALLDFLSDEDIASILGVARRLDLARNADSHSDSPRYWEN